MKKMIFLLAITFICILTLTTGCSNKFQTSPVMTVENTEETAATEDISTASPATETVTSTETAESEPASKPWWAAPTASVVKALRGGDEIQNRPTVKGSVKTIDTAKKLATPWNIPDTVWVVEIDESMTEKVVISGVGGEKEISLSEAIQSGVATHFANPENGDAFQTLASSCGRQMEALQVALGPYDTAYGMTPKTVLVACTQPYDWKDISVGEGTEKVALIICDKKNDLKPGDSAVAWRFDKKKSVMAGRTDGWYLGIVTYSDFQPEEGHDYWPPESSTVLWNYANYLITTGPPEMTDPRLYDTGGTWQSFAQVVEMP